MILRTQRKKPVSGKRAGQTMLDYAAILAAILLALFLMSRYLSTGLSGKIKESADVFGGGEVYRPNPPTAENPQGDFGIKATEVTTQTW